MPGVGRSIYRYVIQVLRTFSTEKTFDLLLQTTETGCPVDAAYSPKQPEQHLHVQA